MLNDVQLFTYNDQHMRTELQEILLLLSCTVQCITCMGQEFIATYKALTTKSSTLSSHTENKEIQRVVEHMYMEDILIQISFYLVFGGKICCKLYKTNADIKKCMHILNQWQTKLITVCVAVVNNPHAWMQTIL